MYIYNLRLYLNFMTWPNVDVHSFLSPSGIVPAGVVLHVVFALTSFPVLHLQSEPSATGRGCWTCSSVGDSTGRRFASSYVTTELRESLVSFPSLLRTQKLFLFLRKLPLRTRCICSSSGDACTRSDTIPAFKRDS